MSSTLTAPRKLTPTETATLRSRLRNELVVKGPQDEEDAGDLLDYAFAMIANGKDVAYVVEELTSMEMEVCDAPSAKKLGDVLAAFFSDLIEKTRPKPASSPFNALAASGALGSSRERRAMPPQPSAAARSLHGVALERLRRQAAGGEGRGRRGGPPLPPPPPAAAMEMTSQMGGGIRRDRGGRTGRGEIRELVGGRGRGLGREDRGGR
ncbi:hypothetical protein ACHAW6_011824, partial [Cyclotella cf. meneghiniana]